MTALDQVLERIRTTPPDPDPFPHIVIPDLLPADLYAAALAALPHVDDMDRVSYPGTGHGRGAKQRHTFGYALRDLRTIDGPIGEIRDVFASAAFARALLDKFDDVIPPAKHPHFDDGADDFTTVFDVQVDLPGYAISPHPDDPEKIITFQLHLSGDDSLAPYGTMLCVPKDERATRGRSRRRRATTLLDLVDRGAASKLFRRLGRTAAAARLGLGAQRGWMPWSWFDVAKTTPGLPNSFMAFAPHDRSFHAVSLDAMEAAQRPVLRGFIRTGAETHNWIRPAR